MVVIAMIGNAGGDEDYGQPAHSGRSAGSVSQFTEIFFHKNVGFEGNDGLTSLATISRPRLQITS